MRKIKSVIIALLALGFMVWLYDHYLKRGAVDISLVTKEEGKVVYCRYCDKVIWSDVHQVRVSPKEAPQHRIVRERAVCSDCQNKGVR